MGHMLKGVGRAGCEHLAPKAPPWPGVIDTEVRDEQRDVQTLDQGSEAGFPQGPWRTGPQLSRPAPSEPFSLHTLPHLQRLRMLHPHPPPL